MSGKKFEQEQHTSPPWRGPRGGFPVVMKGPEYNPTRRDFLRTLSAGAGFVWLSPWRVSWASPTADAGTLRLLYYTDLHTRVEWDTPLALDMAAAKMNEQGAELAIAGGDLITDGFQSSSETVAPRWNAYMKMHRSLRADVHPMIGNHDLVAADPDDGTPPSENPRREFLDHFALDRTYRSFDAQGYHFIFLDPIEVLRRPQRYRGYIDDEQLAWLKEDLAEVNPDTPIILGTHIPLLTNFTQATEGATIANPFHRVVENNREVLDVFRAHNLLLVLQGHVHVDELIRWRGTTFITGGAICGRWWRGEWHGTNEGFGMVTLQPGRIDWEYIEYGWTARRPAHL